MIKMSRLKNKLILFALLILFSETSYSKAFIDIEWYNTDSLQAILPLQSGTEKMATLNRLAASLSFEGIDASDRYAGQALQLALKLKNSSGQAAAYRNFGRARFYNGEYPAALDFFQKSLALYEELNDKKMMAETFFDIAITHFYARNIRKSLEIVFTDIMPLYRSKRPDGQPVGSLKDTLRARSKAGLPLRMTGRSDTALRMYQHYVRMGKKYHFNNTDLLIHEGLIAACFNETGNLDSSIIQYKMALAYPEFCLDDIATKHESMRRLGDVYDAIGQPDTAIKYYHQALEWLAGHGFLKSAQKAAYHLGKLYYNLHNTTEARKYLSQSELLLNEMIQRDSYYRHDSLKYVVSYGSELYLPFPKKIVEESIYNQAVMLYGTLHRLYLDKNALQSAMHYLRLQSAAKDTLAVITRNREAIEIQTRFETERKNAEIGALSQANQLNEFRLRQFTWYVAGLGALAVFILFSALFFHRQNKLKNSHNTLILQQKLLRSQMNPHFIFNSLASIQNSIINDEPAKASKYLSRFSRLVRNILDSTVEEFVLLEDEITTIENYLALQKFRFPDKFDYTIEVDESLDVASYSLPPMLAQPFIENAIEHGMKNRLSKGQIVIRFNNHRNRLVLEIEDDGIGRQKARELTKNNLQNHKSLATQITLDRIKTLNNKRKNQIGFYIIDLKNKQGIPCGTKVVFELPLNK
jgi:tetratricopeptide (TPR) repeat protein